MRSLMRARVLELQYEMLCQRTARRQQAAKAALVHRGVVPYPAIATGYVPPSISSQYVYLPVGGLRS
ncbi:hypothetical protein [Paraburkholderia nemoris]|uniref:hypothetical protein n=1 Tax=Paraburkholderia nemoris TaxID=2793076 RepID=UPI001B27088E|nr:hypothetical protein [Paraburkholderia nemoris]CAE6839253.1 hypothetical protein R75777_06988 [Paraburkholderia nemoris]